MADLKDNQEQSDVEVPAPKMKRKQYEKQMRLLYGKLVAMQEWVKRTRGLRSASCSRAGTPPGREERVGGYVPPDLPLRYIPTPF